MGWTSYPSLRQRTAHEDDPFERAVVIGIARRKAEPQIHLESGLHGGGECIEVHCVEPCRRKFDGRDDQPFTEAGSAKCRAHPKPLHLTPTGDVGDATAS